MDNILLNRLSTIASNIDMLAQSEICSKIENLEEAKIHAAKLKSMLTRFETELLQYFNLCNEPDADEISNLTTIQLKGEEVLAGMTANINIKSDTSATRTVTSDRRLSKLPELSIPTFSGNLLEWHQFWDQFHSCIDQRNLSDVDKLMYLKASLRGEAKKTIEGLDTTNKNYGIAISTLKERYGKDDLIIDAHYSTLYKIRRAEKIEDCRKTLDEIERHIRVLHSLGEDISHNHLRFMIMEKFPEDIIYEIKMKVKAESIEDLRKQLAVIITAREDASRIFSEQSLKESTQYTAETLHVNNVSNNGNRQFINARHNNQKFNRSKQTFQCHSSVNSNFNKDSRPHKRRYEPENDRRHFDNKRSKYSCFFCQGQHYTDRCKQVKTLEERKQKLNNRCFKCFRLNHFAKQCKERKLKYPHCGQFDSHNQAICPELFKREDLSA
ncbi:uncharacterized protein [Choristoneura fumiferana]|uniref:uncharacterized protein n=1 Tax=Choristoneura fumiferana TaxID=7141 RepID=UPI003D157E3B